ncbi:SGNH/GDSL hydrolase family protein [Paenibacillus thermotolerans]|uniref:SGNH/GDSL hydrolase family protein n=1 Tax=Paenibacillus thermotolerans TaxID=3027807 RepID=UPI002367D720|nr:MULTISPECIES: GDSL-type esterase/lipase family protein [unclassified Paenibacillus]
MSVSKQTAEAFVFTREEALPLRYRPLAGQPVEVRSHSDPAHPDLIRYEQDKDFVVDYGSGSIRRTEGSRIPDGALHPMYGVNEFDHTLYPDYSNRSYTVYADYWTDAERTNDRFTGDGVRRSAFLERTARKLADGKEALYVVYGDSISTGGEASSDSLTYYGRFSEQLQSLFPQSRINIVNKSVGGEATDGGARRVRDDVTPLQPDLVSIGYGMNDQNKYGDRNGVPLPDFESNLRDMIECIREHCDSDIVLVTPCEPNPRWRYTSGDIHRYADAIRKLGAEYNIGVADAHALWRQELSAGKTPESMLLNNINHPNDYGHWIYSCAFAAMLNNNR